MDIAKHIFQLHRVNPISGEVERIKLKRAQVLAYFARHEPALVAMEGCGGAHYWGRELSKLGHTVRLLPAKVVRPFVLRNKTDAADARAIWIAAQHRDIKAVAIKTEHQQSVLALHRVRSQLMKMRVMQTNALRGFLMEFGETLPEGYLALRKALPVCLEALECKLPSMLLHTLREQWARVQGLDQDIAVIELRLKQALSESPACKSIAEIPGIGLLTATAAVATMGDPASFKSGREFAAWVGLVPRQTGTGGRIRQLGISKRGDAYLRTLLMHGARTLVARNKQSTWITGLLARRPFSVAVAAVANKLARILWSVLATGRRYEPAALNAAL
jgi:transposase